MGKPVLYLTGELPAPGDVVRHPLVRQPQELTLSGRVGLGSDLWLDDAGRKVDPALCDLVRRGAPARCPTLACEGSGPDWADQGPDPARSIPVPCDRCGARP